MQDPMMKEKHRGYRLDPESLQGDFIERFTELGRNGFGYLKQTLDEVFKANALAQRDY